MTRKTITQILSLGLVILVAWSTQAQSQPQPEVVPGSRVRVKVLQDNQIEEFKPNLTGTVRKLTPSEMVLKTRSDDDLEVLPWEDITKCEVSVKRGQKGKGAAVGALVGLLVGAFIGFADGDDPSGGFLSMTAPAKAGMGALVLAPIGALVG